ncbi:MULTISPECIES: hypothetical protein [Natronococcus]|uniref:DUF8136 domain-containing protein n=1 Tax=Natronococcus jeotgali DSM 18795 TaxID=1227498 RepID=L9X219_9EURY|nr:MULTISPECIES: hypothetical protein [Natronococcus]ELY55819.1 hypothetical protein C492_15216 [Natronococcus jeotgali DSM 18795]NKE36527.1 hypothetical protein [Natronococcus sp. JC468]
MTFSSTSDEDTEREQILETLSERIQFIDTHLEEMDLDSKENQELAIKWTRTLGSLAGQYRLLMKDTDIDEMQSDLELLEAAKEARSND